MLRRRALALYGPFMRAFVSDADGLVGATPQHLSASSQMPAAKAHQTRRVIPYGFDPEQLQWTEAARTRKADLLSRAADIVPLVHEGFHHHSKMTLWPAKGGNRMKEHSPQERYVPKQVQALV